MDFRYTLRGLQRTPGFTAIAVATLALGIGANTAIFSLVYAVILKPLPYRDPNRLIAVWDTYLPQFPKIGISPLELEVWQKQTGLFERTAWYRSLAKNLNLRVAGSEALEVHATFISPDLLPLLGVSPATGHAFSPHEPPNSVLVSHRLSNRFPGAATVRLNEQDYIVAGVMPPDFAFPDWADIWLPQGPLLGDELTNPVRHALGFVARLKPGVSAAQATAGIESIAKRLAADHPRTSTGFGVRLIGLQDDLTTSLRPALLMLMGAAALILLIACSNVANLLLSRATGRSREIAIRTALGAGAWRIVRQLLTEGLVLSGFGAALGFLLARCSLAAFASKPVPLDLTVLLFLLTVSTASSMLFGLAPALQALRVDPNNVIKSGSVTGGGATTLRGILVVLEFALALVLAAGAGILAKSFLRLMNVDPGFRPQGLLTLRLAVPPSRKPDVLFRRIRESLHPLPGALSVATVNTLPLIANRANTTRFNVPGSPLINPDALPGAQIRTVSPDYFQTMGIPLRAGRAFTERDLAPTFDGVIINEGFARRFWPGRDPVGLKFITGPWGPNPTYSTIVGVVGDVKQFGLDSEPSLDLYFPSLSLNYLVLRTTGELTTAVRQALQNIDPDIAISDVQTMDQILSVSASQRRATMQLLATFAALALILAMVGIYGVMSGSIVQRTREIGIRMALGADRKQVLKLVIQQGMKLSAIGLAIGLATALGIRQVLANLVFEETTADPQIYGGVAILMLIASALACYLPARKALRLDPLKSLRSD